MCGCDSIGANKGEQKVVTKVSFTIVTVQQFKIGQKRRGDRALNQKRSKFFDIGNNCETASIGLKTYLLPVLSIHVMIYPVTFLIFDEVWNPSLK